MLVRILIGLALGLVLGVALGRCSRTPHVAFDSKSGAPVGDANTAPSLVVAAADLDSTAAAPNAPAARREIASAQRAFDEERGVILHGRVVDEGGERLPNGALRIETADGGVQPVHVDARGSFAVVGVAPGAVRLVGERQGFADLALDVDVPAVHEFALVVVMTNTPTLPVHFMRTDGTPWPYGASATDLVAQIGVIALREPPPPVIASQSRRRAEFAELSRFDPDTEFASRGIAPERPCHGLLALKAPPPLFVALLYRNAVVDWRPLTGDEHELVFVFDEARLTALHSTVRVRVVERDSGEPLDVHLALRLESDGDEVVGESSDGAYVWSNVPPGRYQIQCDEPRLEEWSERVDVGPAQDVDLGVRELGEPGEFEIHVKRPDGTPINTFLTVQRLAPDGSPLHRALLGVGAETDRPGVHVMRFVSLGDTLVCTAHAQHVALVARRVDTRSERIVELVVPPADLVEIVPRGLVQMREPFALEDASGLTLHHVGSLPAKCRLAPGAYRLRAFGSGTNDAVATTFVVEAGSTRVEVDVAR
jgi:hypothetical protein